MVIDFHTFEECSALDPNDKPLLKTMFYAACNGGSIKNDEAILRHILKSRPDFDKPRAFAFIKAVKQSIVYKELVELGAFWETFQGKIYVPTREHSLIRRDSFGKLTSYKLSSPIYCSFEFMFITEVIRCVFNYFDNKNITVLQGMHDGIVFLTSSPETDLKELENKVNSYVGSLGKDILGGVPVLVTVKEFSKT